MNRLLNRIDSFVDDRIEKTDCPDAKGYFESRGVQDKQANIARYLDVIDSSSSTLLTHISAMIAVLGIMMLVFENDHSFTKFFVLLEMIAYTALALVCVFNIRYRTPTPIRRSGTDNQVEIVERYYRFYVRRRYINHYCVHGVMLVTALFIVTLILHVIL